MNCKLAARLTAALAVASLSGTALAQAGWTPGAELIGQPIQVTTNGVTNTLRLNPGGQAQIMTHHGMPVAASWTTANGQLCLGNGAAQECYPYASPFQAGQPVTLTSSCNAASTWLAQSTNAPANPPSQRGERGR